MPSTLTARCERILYPRGEVPPGRQFLIVKTDRGVLKGHAAWTPGPGSRLEATGSWAVSKYNGKPEFQFTVLAPHVPVDEHSTLVYACELAHGCGPALAEALWGQCRDAWRTAPAGAVRGYTEARRSALLDAARAIASDGARTRAVTYLLGHAATLRMAEAAWDAWGIQTIPTVEGDPFRLAELPNFSFQDVDSRVRPAFGIADDDPRRLRAAILHSMRRLADASTLVPWPALRDAVAVLVRSSGAITAAGCKALFSSGDLVPVPSAQSIATRRDAEAETAIAEYAASPAAPVPSGVSSFADLVGIVPDASQLAAIERVVHAPTRLSIVNGGPGTGKTTIVRLLAARLPAGSLDLCAFAGKAAARLREATGHPASTIHRLLEWQGERFAKKSLVGRIVLVDEASMVDSALLAEIVRRQPDRLILVGDEAQLPPVGAGQPFHDLVRLRPGIVSTLTHGHRNREAVAEAAAVIRDGRVPPPAIESASERWVFEARRDAQAVHDEIVRLAKAGEIDFSRDIVLTSRNGDADTLPASVNALNAAIKAAVNPSAEPIAPGDRIICTKNCPDLDVWNGTTATLDAIDIDGALWVTPDTEGASRIVPRDHARDWTLAYALTVHKAQGSQYRRVWFCCLSRDAAVLLDRPLLYTAATRATAECRVLGDHRALAAAVGRVTPRNTLLQHLLTPCQQDPSTTPTK